MRINSTDLHLGAGFARACSITLHLLLCFVAFAAVKTSAEQTNSMAQAMSLADCIQTALEHNLNIKIERFNPSIARYNVSLAFAAYEPILSAGGTHTFNLSPGGIDAQNRPFNGTTTESDSFEAGLTGVLPTGLNYSLGGNLADAAGIGQTGHSRIPGALPQSNCANHC